MVTPMNYRFRYIAATAFSVVLTACASSDERFSAPSYASMYDGDTYRVICTGTENRDVYVRYNALETFYNPDGSLKSRDHFCRENASGASQR